MRHVSLILLGFILALVGCQPVNKISVSETPTQRDSVRAGVLFTVDLYKDPAASLLEARDSVESGTWFSVERAVERRTADGTPSTFYKVTGGGTSGWVDEEDVSTPRKYRSNHERVRDMREEGHTVLPVYQSFSKNSADGITIGFAAINISESKTVKYIRTTWELYNKVGDPVEGENSGSSTAKVRLTGPIKPMEGGSSRFENIWYSTTGVCAELRGLQIEHIDGSTATIADLENVTHFSNEERFQNEAALSLIVSQAMEGDVAVGDDAAVKTRGDCSYESQQRRN